ncbi:hypothetical protein [Limnoglobus roseus]|uniref:Uncharacterized protein n=1 Tax=Limnoglobus roseus TaxID=2598579 RepID=A0A5C1A6E7_9BACT|nr:hypothetical protein [Limnoglobus roseus]QEL13566.1 hypothetical protein PX52LOC_00424 [Limnoglobus roseus]
MRFSLLAVVLTFALPVAAADPPLAEKYLHSGQLAVGEQAIERELKAHPSDDQLRFGLGLIQLVRGVERLGQSLYEYGAKSDSSSLPFLRLPVPKNPQPNAITYQKFRTLIDDFRRDLEKTEATLANITDDRVKLPLRLAPIKLDLDGDGRPTHRFLDLMRSAWGASPEFLKKNPEFRVGFDRGDVAWLRSYCHLTMGAADLILAVDFEADFYADRHGVFPNVKPRPAGGSKPILENLTIRFAEPARLAHLRGHWLQVAKLNREAWRFIRSETDDDDEWLPNPKQKSVIGLPVRDEMIDRWLAFLAELEGVLEGKKLIQISPYLNTDGKDLDLKAVLDDPPAAINFHKIIGLGIDAKYLRKGECADTNVLLGAAQIFDAPLSGMYMIYFN